MMFKKREKAFQRVSQPINQSIEEISYAPITKRIAHVTTQSASTKFNSDQLQQLLHIDIPLNINVTTIDPQIVEQTELTQNVLATTNQKLESESSDDGFNDHSINNSSQISSEEEELKNWENNIVKIGIGKKRKSSDQNVFEENNAKSLTKLLNIDTMQHISSLQEAIEQDVNSISKNLSKSKEISDQIETLQTKVKTEEESIKAFQDIELIYLRIAQYLEEKTLASQEEDNLKECLLKSETITSESEASQWIIEVSSILKDVKINE